jgi:hypothetical protein
MRYYTAKGNTAKIHVGSCGFCKDGNGNDEGTRADNGKWHGPFDTLSQAKAAMRGVTPDACRCAQ